MHRLSSLRSVRTSRFARSCPSRLLIRLSVNTQQDYLSLPPSIRHFSSTNWAEEVKKLLGEQRHPSEAQKALDQVRISGQVSSDEIKTATATEDLFNAWILHQTDLLRNYDSKNPDVKQLREICQAAENAHRLLEFMLPSLSSRRNLSPPMDGIDQACNQIEEQGMYEYQDGIDATARCNAVLAVWAAASKAGHQVQSRVTRNIPQRAQFLLEQMELSYRKQDSSDIIVMPSVESYNLVIEAWAHGQEHLPGSMAERVYRKLCNSESRPNSESHKLIIVAWALSRERRAAFTATGHLMKMIRSFDSGDEDMEPSLEDYRIVLRSWVSAEDKTSPIKAMSVLRLMDQSFEKGISEVLPDYDCFRFLLYTASKRPLLPNLGAEVDHVLSRMSERFMVPDTACYGAAIRTWKNEALNPELIETRDRSVARTLELLAEMKVAHNQSTAVVVRPSTRIVNDVLEVLFVSSNPRRWEQAEHLLSEMEVALVSDGDEAAANAETYRRVINVWKTSKSEDKVAHAKSVLLRFQESFENFPEIAEKDDEAVKVFSAFVGVCGTAEVKTEKEGLRVLKEALSAIDSIRALGLDPHSETFANLLSACARLLAPGKEQQSFVGKVFRLCCDAGMVNGNVLRKFKSVASPGLYLRMVTSPSEEVEGTKVVPEAWTSKVSGRNVISADGRRATPLSIDGELVVTRAIQEFRMRKIRDKRNRKWLRGGRLPLPGRRETVSHETRL